MSLGSAELDITSSFNSAFHPPVPYVWKKYPNCQPVRHLAPMLLETDRVGL